MHFCLLA
jgi:hypothetical protein